MRLNLRRKVVLLNVLLVAAMAASLWVYFDGALAGALVGIDAEAARSEAALVLAGAFAVFASLAVAVALVSVRSFNASLLRAIDEAETTAETEAERHADAHLEPIAGRFARINRDLGRVVGTLAEERNRFEAVLVGIDAAVFAIDKRDQITVVNPAMLKLFGIESSPVGRPWDDVIALPALADCISEAREGRNARMELEPQDSARRRVLVAYASPQGSGDGVAVVLRDVTAIRHLERVRRDFVANVSHELGTPITVIQTSAETLLDGALDDPTHARRFVAAIDRHAARLSNIIAGLLDLARLEAGQRGLAKERVNLRAAALRAKDLVRDLAKDRQVRVTVEVPKGVKVLADTNGIDQVLSNLVQNAVKYNEIGGSVAVRLGVSESGAGDSVRLEVADDGPGIRRKHRERVFERFYRVDKGRSREEGGTGLGLAIVKHLVLAMGGNVGAEKNPPQGSTFWLELPVAPAKGRLSKQEERR